MDFKDGQVANYRLHLFEHHKRKEKIYSVADREGCFCLCLLFPYSQILINVNSGFEVGNNNWSHFF